MNLIHSTSFAAPLTVIAALTLSPQSIPVPQADGLRRVAVPAAQSAEDADAETWRRRLANEDLAARESDFDALVDQASANETTRAALEAWSQDRAHLEFAWTCRLALREVKARETHGARGSLFDSEDPFEALRRHMFGGGAHLDPFEGWLVDPLGQGGYRFGGPLGQSAPFNLPPGASTQSQSQGLSLEMGPDGVKVRVKKDVDGKTTEEEYTAKTIEELFEAHPELSGQLGGFHIGTGGGAGGGIEVFRFGMPGFQFDRGFRGTPRTDKLGVYIQDKQAGADAVAGDGLRIEAIQPGSLAERLGLERGQVLLRLNGRELKSRDDISEELKSRDPAATIEVEVRAADGTVTTKSWTPTKDPRGEARPLAPKPLPGARKV